MGCNMLTFAASRVYAKEILSHPCSLPQQQTTLSAMFTHALQSRVLVGVPIGSSGSICHLQYADDLIIFFAGGHEDLQVIKLNLYLFEGSSGFTINFSKSYLYSTNYGFQPNTASAVVFNCANDCLPFIYLGVPLSGGRPRRQDWMKLILMVRAKLTSQKANYLSLENDSPYLILLCPQFKRTGCRCSNYMFGQWKKQTRFERLSLESP